VTRIKKPKTFKKRFYVYDLGYKSLYTSVGYGYAAASHPHPRGKVITNVDVALDDELNNCPTPYMELNKSARTSQTGQTDRQTDRTDNGPIA